jgi:hypothetical protein
METGNSEMLNALEKSMVDCSREPPRGGGCFSGNEAIRDEATYHMLLTIRIIKSAARRRPSWNMIGLKKVCNHTLQTALLNVRHSMQCCRHGQ